MVEEIPGPVRQLFCRIGPVWRQGAAVLPQIGTLVKRQASIGGSAERILVQDFDPADGYLVSPRMHRLAAHFSGAIQCCL